MPIKHEPNLVDESRMREIRMSGLTSGEWKRNRPKSLSPRHSSTLPSHLLRLAGGRLERRWAWIAVRTVCSHTALPQSYARLAPACLALRLATKLVIYPG